MSQGLTLDYSLCGERALGHRGFSRLFLEAMRIPLGWARESLARQHEEGGLAWLDLPHADPADIVSYAREARSRFDTLVVLGIGGSALGTSALARALLHPYHNLQGAQARGGPRLFVLDNVDPDEIAGLLSQVDLSTTLVNVVSKSGATAETMAAYLLARSLLEERLGAQEAVEHLVFTTDPEAGVLRRIGEADGIRMFPVPPGVGGRFSVLSAVGLLPAAVCGIDVAGLLAGARAGAARSTEGDVAVSPAYVFAVIQYLQYVRFDRRVTVMMPYSTRLRDVADWYRQLWAESLGKAKDRKGREVHVGPTPVEALGATDQHSQVQLYAEGPDDKVITFLRVESFVEDPVIPALHPEEDALAYLGGRKFSELLNIEQRATAWALARQGRPSLTITLPRVDAASVGELLYTLEVATAVAGELFDVDAFDQPGVELGKQATYALMGRPGFEGQAAAIEKDTASWGGA